MKDNITQTLQQNLPPIFTRLTAEKLMGGLVDAGTLANLDSAGDGPPVKIRLGRKVAYERSSFIGWFVARLESADNQPVQKPQRRRGEMKS